MTHDLERVLHLFEFEDGIPDFDEIKAKYKQLMMQYHPDSYRGDDVEEALEMSQEINWAYEYLKGHHEELKRMANGFDFGGTAFGDYTIYSGYVVNTVKKYYEDGYFQNKSAYINRIEGLFSTSYCKYCWDASYENYRSFHGSILAGVNDKLIDIIDRNYGTIRDAYGYKLPQYFIEQYVKRIGYWAELEYILPYHNLCQLFKIEPRTFQQKLDTQTKKLLKRSDAIEETNIVASSTAVSNVRQGVAFIKLGGMRPAGRRERVDKLKVGERLKAFWFTDNPIYPNTIMVCNAENESLGTVDPEYSLCIVPLLISGYVDLHIKVHSIYTRKQLSRQFPEMTMELRVVLKKEIPDEHPALFTKQIKDNCEDFKNLCTFIKQFKYKTPEDVTDAYNVFMKSFEPSSLKKVAGLNVYTVKLTMHSSGGMFKYSKNCGIKPYTTLPEKVLSEMIKDVQVLTVGEHLDKIANSFKKAEKHLGKHTIILTIAKKTAAYEENAYYFDVRYMVYESLDELE